ncbi:hypothetical protein [Phaeobacter sp. HF9A]|uniref:hypothetical protein n=1 Tax=Phaeobacter sp. HF9A TaxID=2721561 RepID=UPI001430F1D2|nr:hypothetical protein [Phaeobacter sp. HF9A]NIZ14469.1 hypothetical protein [Phaeobacter sp. HF9A]
MTDFEKLARARRDLEDIRNDLAQRISDNESNKADLVLLHDRVSRAIKALHGNT